VRKRIEFKGHRGSARRGWRGRKEVGGGGGRGAPGSGDGEGMTEQRACSSMSSSESSSALSLSHPVLSFCHLATLRVRLTCHCSHRMCDQIGAPGWDIVGGCGIVEYCCVSGSLAYSRILYEQMSSNISTLTHCTALSKSSAALRAPGALSILGYFCVHTSIGQNPFTGNSDCKGKFKVEKALVNGVFICIRLIFQV